jgi:dTDP-4-dehydrorhamnose reductase
VLELVQRAGVELKVTPDKIEPVPTSAFQTPAKRPHNSRMNTEKLRSTFGLHLPNWQTGVSRMLAEILEK